MRYLLVALAALTLSSIDSVRSSYKKAIDDSDIADELYESLDTVTKNSPLLLAYKGAVSAVRAKHAYSPYSKLSYVKEGYGYLNEAVTADSSNLEIRYLRYSIEFNIPSFLPYRDHLQKDKASIITKLLSKNQSLKLSIQKEIADFMIKNAELDAATKEQLKRSFP